MRVWKREKETTEPRVHFISELRTYSVMKQFVGDTRSIF